METTAGEICYSFSISNDLTQMGNFPTQTPDCNSHSLALLDFFLSSDASVCSAMAFPPLRNSDDVVVSVTIDFLSNSKLGASFHCIAYDILALIGTVFVIISEMLRKTHKFYDMANFISINILF